MKTAQLASGIILLILYALAYIYRESILALPLLFLGVFMVLAGARAKNLKGIQKKEALTIFDGLISIGKEKIRRGEMTVSEDVFLSSMEKLKPFIMKQDSMPQLGFNSIYLNYRNEAEAENEMKNISSLGMSCIYVHDKSNHSVKIDF